MTEEETARKRREAEEAERGDHEHADGDRDDHEHADGDRNDPEGLAMKGTTTSTWTSTTTTTTTTTTTPHDEPSSETMRAHAKGGQQESASATYERARKDAAPHAQEPSSETMGGAEVPERGMDQVALV